MKTIYTIETNHRLLVQKTSARLVRELKSRDDKKKSSLFRQAQALINAFYQNDRIEALRINGEVIRL